MSEAPDQQIRPLLLEGVALEHLQSEKSGIHETFRLSSASGAAKLPQPLVALAMLFNGQLTIVEIETEIRSWGFEPPQKDFVLTFARQLSRAGLVLLENQSRSTMPTAGPMHFECLKCGSSCIGAPVGPLSEEAAEQIQGQWSELVRHLLIPPHLRPISYDEQDRPYLARHDGRCTFLFNDMRCLIHSHFGEAEKPVGCRVFPLVATEIGGDVRLGFSSHCFRLHRSFEAPHPEVDLVALYDAHSREDGLRPVFRRYAASAETDSSRQHHESFSNADRQSGHERTILASLEHEPGMDLFDIVVIATAAKRSKKNRSILPGLILDEIASRLAAWARRVHNQGDAWPQHILFDHPHGALLNQLTAHLAGAPAVGREPLPERWRRFLVFQLRNQLWIREGYRVGKLEHAILFFGLGVAAATSFAQGIDDEEAAYDRFGETLALWSVTFQLPENALSVLGWRDREKLLKRWKQALRRST